MDIICRFLRLYDDLDIFWSLTLTGYLFYTYKVLI